MAEPTSTRLEPQDDGPTPDVGDPAPGFTLRRTFEESVSLADMTGSGPVLLAFYVFDFGHV